MRHLWSTRGTVSSTKVQAIRESSAPRVRWAEVAAACFTCRHRSLCFVLVSKKSAKSTSIVLRKKHCGASHLKLSETSQALPYRGHSGRDSDALSKDRRSEGHCPDNPRSSRKARRKTCLRLPGKLVSHQSGEGQKTRRFLSFFGV